MKRRALVALAAAGALVLTACGGDDPAEESTETATEAETATESAAPTETATEAETATESAAPTETSTEGAASLPDPLIFTLTPSQETGGLIETAQPLADMMSERLGVTVEALVPTDYAGVIAALSSGQAHVAGGLGPRQMVQSEEQADATMILQSERFGSFSYVTQWFTNDPDTFCSDEPVAIEQDEGEPWLFCNGVAEAQEAYAADGTLPTEPIGQDALTDVAGKTVAFVDQGSTSGYAIPALQLLEAGVDPLEDISGTFAGGHDRSVQAVYDGDAAVGVSFNDARSELVEQAPDVGQKVVVFGWSSPIPNDGFAVASSIDEAGTQAITDALLAICNDDGACGEGGVMYELYEIDGLAPVNDAEFDVIRNLEAELGEALE